MELLAGGPLQMTLDDATAFVRRLRAAAKSLVFTNGVFDLLHPGHVRYLQQARALGDAPPASFDAIEERLGQA